MSYARYLREILAPMGVYDLDATFNGGELDSEGTALDTLWEELEEIGKRKLAYEINYLTEGYYVLMKFTSGPEFPAELDRILGITDGILRRLITMRAE